MSSSTETYKTVDKPASIEFSIRGSKFIGHIRPATSVSEAAAIISTIENEYEDATHNVPAYRIRADPFREYASDDGEPTGSAGKPALRVLSNRELENVVAVVTRYYGGTNLGTGGLVRSYARAVNEAVEAAGIVNRRPHSHITITASYDDSGTVRQILESESVCYDAEYDVTVTFAVDIPIIKSEAVLDRILSATSGRVELD